MPEIKCQKKINLKNGQSAIVFRGIDTIDVISPDLVRNRGKPVPFVNIMAVSLASLAEGKLDCSKDVVPKIIESFNRGMNNANSSEKIQ